MTRPRGMETVVGVEVDEKIRAKTAYRIEILFGEK
jgi:hypothetical protein